MTTRLVGLLFGLGLAMATFGFVVVLAAVALGLVEVVVFAVVALGLLVVVFTVVETLGLDVIREVEEGVEVTAGCAVVAFGKGVSCAATIPVSRSDKTGGLFRDLLYDELSAHSSI